MLAFAMSRAFDICGSSRRVLAAIAFDALFPPPPAAAEIPAIASRQRAEKKTFTDSEIVEGFFKTAFGAEYHLAGRVDRIRKYDMPVRVFADGNRADRKAQLAKIVADIGQRVQHLDIAMAESSDERQCPGQAGARPRSQSHHLELLRQRTRPARSRPRSIRNACPAFARTTNSKSSTPTCFSPSTTAISSSSTAAMKSCCSRWDRSTTQSSVPWTMFNDNVSMGFFDVYDQYILNILYDPRIKAGMTIAEVKAVLPEVLADVRVWVKKVNGLAE